MATMIARVRVSSAAGLVALLILTGAAQAAETVVYLRSDVTTVTMPDSTVVTMWGFAQDSAFGADDGVVSIPGPRITVPPGNSLRIQLKNNLTAAATGLPMGCPVCIVIPGQNAVMSPVRFGAAPYPQYEGRIRSLTHETAPGNVDPVDYVWPELKPGTYLYHSGTHMQCHVQMGLYGAMTQDTGTGEAYPGVEYDRDILLLYSEIDPEFHAAVATANYGPGHDMSSTINYRAQYALINGQPFSEPYAGASAVDSGERVLLRFLNAGLKSHAPTFLGAYVSLIAEDGNPYPYAREQYSVLLPAGKTHDALFLPMDGGRIPIVDSTLHLTNAAAPSGGMLTYLDVAAPPPNTPPAQPTLVSPSNNLTNVSQTATLTSSPFSDPDPGDTHAATRWVIDDNADFSSPAFDSGADAANLTTLTVPVGALAKYTYYYWRVMYSDTHGDWSPWSASFRFRTVRYNSPPAQPALLSPANGATGVSQTPTLTASAFVDADGDAHSRSRWVIDDNADFSSPVLFSSGATNLTSFTVPAGKLVKGKVYYWTVGYRDAEAWSPYAVPRSFTTVTK